MKFPDTSIPKFNAYALAILGFSSICLNLISMTFSFYSWDIGPFCFLAAPWGILFLVVNIQTYLVCRKKYIREELSQPAATFIAVEAAAVNAFPIILGIATFISGVLLGASNNPWLADISMWEFLSGSVFLAMLFYPFNVLGLLVSMLAWAAIRRNETWIYAPNV